MRSETKMQVIGFLGFLETSGKLNAQEYKRLREALEEKLPLGESQEMPDRPLTRREVAKFLKVSTRTVDRMCENGSLKFWRLGPRYIRFKFEDILALIAQSESSNHESSSEQPS